MNSIIENFYSAFKNHDAESMVAYYHDDIIFEDAQTTNYKKIIENNLENEALIGEIGLENAEDESDFDDI